MVTVYDEMIDGAIDVHCHIDFEFSAKERKRAACVNPAGLMGLE